MSEIRNDGVLINTLTQMGTARDKSQYTTVGFAPILSKQQQEELSQDVFLGRILSAKPDAAVSKWCEVDLGEDNEDDPETLRKFQTYRDVVAATQTTDGEMASDREIFSWAGFLANVYGGSAIVMILDDGKTPDQPVNVKGIKSIIGCEVLDRHKIRPKLLGYSPWDFTHYELILPPHDSGSLISGMFDRVEKKGQYISYGIHRSRVLRIPGVRVPPDVMFSRYDGWDRSLCDQIFDAFSKWMSTYSDVGNLIHDYSLFVYMMKGLRDMVSEGGESQLRSRFQALKLSVSSLGGAAIDAEDEKIEFLQRQFGGIPDLMDKFRDLLIGASDVPHTKIFGESPSGLGATGESEERTWAATVNEYQVKIFEPRLRRLYKLIMLAKDGPTNGELPEGWTINWNPLIPETREQQITNQSTFIQALSTALSAGFILPEEARMPFESPKLDYTVKLDRKAWEEKQQQEQQGFDFGGFGGFGDTGAEQPATDSAAAAGDTEATQPEQPGQQTNQDSLNNLRWDAIRFPDRPAWEYAYRKGCDRFLVRDSAYFDRYVEQEYLRAVGDRKR